MNWRKNHRNIGLIITLPLTITVLTGLILQLRGQFEIVQPKAISTKLSGAPLLTLEQIEEKVGREEIDQVIWKPGKTSLVVRLKSSEEVHLHPETGEVLKKVPRLTNSLIDFHQGSWLGPFGQYGVNLLSGLGLFFLILSGLIIYPFKRKRS